MAPSVRVAVLLALLQAAVVAICLLAIGASLPEPPARYALRNAAVVTPGGTLEPVVLPAHFPGTPPHQIILRMAFDAPEHLKQEWSVLTPRFTNAAQMLVNGAVVLDTRRSAHNNRIDRNAPDLAVIPAQLLRPGVNDLTVRLFVWGPLSGYLDPVFVGPDSALRPPYNLRVLLFDTLPLMFSAWQVILAIILGIMWFKRRSEVAYGVLAAAMALGAFHTFLVPPDQRTWIAGVKSALIGSAPLETGLVLIFCALFLGKKLSRGTVLLALTPGLIMLVAGLYGGPEAVRRAFVWIGLPSIGLCLAGLAWLTNRAALERRDLVSTLLACAATVLITCWARDLLTVTGAISGQRIFVARLSYAAVMTVTGACLIWRFASTLNEVDSFAGRLVQQVQAAEDKLRASFTRDAERRRTAALASERLRLTRDLHDGLGGQLVSIVALAERTDVNGGQIGEAARGALRDLRLVIDAMDDIDGDLMLALGAWRERTAARLGPHNIHLNWRSLSPDGLPRHEELRPWHVIQLLRLLDEAVTNTVKHAGARCITVSFGVFTDDANARRGRIVMADNGCGFPAQAIATATAHGRGLDNMRRRAERCRVAMRIDSSPGGVCITLDLPRHFPEADPAA